MYHVPEILDVKDVHAVCATEPCIEVFLVVVVKVIVGIGLTRASGASGAP
jgi:hypothetical protein